RKGFVYYFNQKPATLGENRYFDDFVSGDGYVTGCGGSASSEGSECLQEIRITSTDVIKELCFNFTVIGDTCDGDIEDMAFISFSRPRANAIILKSADDGTAASEQSNLYIKI